MYRLPLKQIQPPNSSLFGDLHPHTDTHSQQQTNATTSMRRPVTSILGAAALFLLAGPTQGQLLPGSTGARTYV